MKKTIFIFLIHFFAVFHAQDKETFRIKDFQVSKLSDTLEENSGLSLLDERLFTINDSGNSPEIFEIDKNSGKILKIIKIQLQNQDWEAITNEGSNFYIGDFGNNSGTRKDLKIYKIGLDSALVAPAKTISFYYPEQNDFSAKPLNNDFDAEAMIFLNGKIHVFTKEWASKKTTHYIINPEITENQPAQKMEDFPTDFVVTDASYFDKKLYLVGYTKSARTFLEIFDETEPGIFFKQNPKKYFIGNTFSVGQIEGIAVNTDGIYISGERFNFKIFDAKQSLYFIPWEKLK